MWLLDELQKHSQDHRPAVVERTGTYTFADIWQYSELIAQDLDACGRQTPVVIYGDKDPGIVPTMKKENGALRDVVRRSFFVRYRYFCPIAKENKVCYTF